MAGGVSDLAIKVGLDATQMTAGARKVAMDVRSIEKSLEPTRMSMRRMRTEAKRVWEETRTPLERYSYELQRLEVLYQKGAINAETYRRAVQKATTAYQQATARQSRFAAGMANLGRSLLAFVGPTVLAVTGIYKLVGAFRSAEEMTGALNQSLAILPRSAERFRTQMTETAFDVAYATGHPAEEIAKAYYYLESAGMDATQSIAAMPQVAKFARAGMFDLSRATDLATDAQKALGMSSEDAQQNLKQLTRVTDVLVKANTLGNATVEQFSQSLTSKAGAAFRLVGKDVEEAVSVLVAMANQGLKADEAGTQLSRVMINLKMNAITNAEAFKRFNIRVYDATGEMRHFANIIADMEKAFAGLSDREKQAAITSLGFTKRSADTAAVLLGTSEEIRKFNQALDEAGGTTEMVANRQLPPLTKAWRELKTVIAETTRGPLTSGLQGMADLMGEFARAAHGFQPETLGLGALKELREDIKNMGREDFQRASERFAKYGVDIQRFLQMSDAELEKHREAISKTQNSIETMTLSLKEMSLAELQRLQQQTSNVFEKWQLGSQWRAAQREKERHAEFSEKLPAEQLLPTTSKEDIAARKQTQTVIERLDQNANARRARRALREQQLEEQKSQQQIATQQRAQEMAREAHRAQEQQVRNIIAGWREAEYRLRGITREQRAIMNMEGQRQVQMQRMYERRLQIEQRLKDLEAGTNLQRQLRTPREEANAKLADYGRLLSVGAIDLDTAQRAALRDAEALAQRASELQGPSLHERGSRGAAEAILRHQETSGRQDMLRKEVTEAINWLRQIAQNTNPQAQTGGVQITGYPKN